MQAFYNLWCIKTKNMAEKTYTLYVRGVSKDVRNSLKRMAKKITGSTTVNGFMLKQLESMTEDERKDFELAKLSKK